MTRATARRVRGLRIAAQIVFLALFAGLVVAAGHPLFPRGVARSALFILDPLWPILYLASTRTVLWVSLIALIPLAAAFAFGRFFCGWVCPMGSLHQFASWALRKRAEPGPAPDARWLRPKYLILVFIVVAAFFGPSIGGWLDPFSILIRSVGSAIAPAISAVVPAAAGGLKASVQPVFIGGIFLVLLGLNAVRRRFFCNTLCPLGALHGLAARLGALRFETGPDCHDCGVCSRGCSFGGDPAGRFMASECTVCFNCAADCPRDAVAVRLAGRRPRPAAKLSIVDLDRRRVLGTAVFGAAAAALSLGSLASRRSAKRTFLRPPGAVAEKTFLKRCLRCGTCVEACPTGFIQPAALEAGIEGLWTPVGNARAGACEYDCIRCTRVCPSRAIETMTPDEKKRFKIGTAVVDRSLCFTHAEGFDCTVCADHCPVPEKAIRFHDAEVWDFQGKRTMVRQTYVVPDLCIGCGICENVCPRGGSPGIRVIPEDETRESPGR